MYDFFQNIFPETKAKLIKYKKKHPKLKIIFFENKSNFQNLK